MKLQLVSACLAIAVAGPFVLTGCDALKKDDASAKKEKKGDGESDSDEDDKDTKKKKKKAKSDDKAGADTATAVAKTPDGAPSVKDVATPATPSPVTDPSQQTYPDVTNKIADNCASPWVIMATAPNSVGIDYPWTWSRQAMLANQQFKIVSGEPAAPGEVTFQLHQASDRYNNAWVLIGKCQDGGTCNKLAAMYKGIVKGSQSQPVCGSLQMDLSQATFKKPMLRDLGVPQNSLPSSSDVPAQCARLQACSVAMDPPSKAGKENIGFDCQKAPSKFKTACATKYPCAEVMKCLEGS